MGQDGDEVFPFLPDRLQAFGQFVLPNRTEHQRFVHRRRVDSKEGDLGGVYHLDHQARRAFIGPKDRPHRVGPVDGLPVAVSLFREGFGPAGAIHALEQAEAAVHFTLRHAQRERLADQFVPARPRQPQEGVVDLADDGGGSLDGEHRVRGKLGKVPAELRQTDRVAAHRQA